MKKNAIINLSFDSTALSVKAFGVFIIFALLMFLSGCDNDKVVDGEDTPDPNMTMNLKSGVDPVYMDNAEIYVFTNADKFVEKKLNVFKNDNKLSTYMPVGTWNLVLLTCNSSLAGKISLPPYGGANTYPMWKTGYTDNTENFLSQAPAELRYAPLPNTTIIENSVTKKQATLNRNVAKIQVVLEDYTGFDQIYPGKNNYAFVELLDVPTTLDWRGQYYPDRDNPDHSGNKPIREYFNFDSALKADVVDFIIPAHRGSDAFETPHNDVTTHKLRFRISMPLKGMSYYGKTPIVIQSTPKINSIIRLLVTFRGEPNTDLDVKVTVKEWEDPINQVVEFD